MDSPRLDVTHLQVMGENEVISVTRKPMFFWVDLTTVPGKALAYEVDTKRCWTSGTFDPTKAVLRAQIPRPFPIDHFLKHFKASEGVKSGVSGVYTHSLGEHFAIRMKHDFCSHSPDLTKCMEGHKGDWLVFNGELNIPVNREAFEQAFVKTGSYTTSLGIKEPQWERDSFGMPVVGKKNVGLKADNVIAFPRVRQSHQDSASLDR